MNHDYSDYVTDNPSLPSLLPLPSSPLYHYSLLSAPPLSQSLSPSHLPTSLTSLLPLSSFPLYHDCSPLTSSLSTLPALLSPPPLSTINVPHPLLPSLPCMPPSPDLPTSLLHLPSSPLYTDYITDNPNTNES